MATVKQLRPQLGGQMYDFVRFSKDGFDEIAFTDLQAEGEINSSYLIGDHAGFRVAGPFNKSDVQNVCELINNRVSALKTKKKPD